MRYALILLWVAVALPAAADRVKIDRYEPATLPEVELWLTLLADDRPVPPDDALEFSVHVDGQVVREDIEWETAKEAGRPIAVAVVADARSSAWWARIGESLPLLVDALPEGSVAVGALIEVGVTRLPEKGWTTAPAELPPTLAQVRADGQRPLLYEAMKTALNAFPLNEGQEAEEWEGEPEKWTGEDPFPADRVLYVIADGNVSRERRYRSRRMRWLVNMARRRNVRIMTIGIDAPPIEAPIEEGAPGDPLRVPVADENPTAHHPVLEVLARKTGGTYRRAFTPARLAEAMGQAARELRLRYVLRFDAGDLRRGDTAEFAVTVQLPTGGSARTRGYSARIGNVLGFWDELADTISNIWEGLPWWARLLVWVGVGLIGLLIVLIVLVKIVRKRRAQSAASRAARAAALAARKPCPVCSNMMMPGWTQCMFCAASQAQQRPMRFRLTGRNNDFVGTALRFDQEIITIGSAPACEVQVMDRGVGAQHCGIRDRGDEFVLTDFNTDTGTWVNGERVSQVILDEGDLLRVGDTEFVFGIEAT